MSEAKDQTLALNVRLKPSEPSVHPKATNYTNVGVAQGIAYLDFGFIEPTLLPPSPRLRRTAKRPRKAWKGISSPAWLWMWTCWLGCISRYSKSWSACAMRRRQRRRPEKVARMGTKE
jgi:hypothetical protein